MKRQSKVLTCEDFHNLYVAETKDIVEFTATEHWFCHCNSSKYREPSPRFLNWCLEKLNQNDKDLAQHFTLSNAWLTEPVKKFIRDNAQNGVLDPYAGDYSMLKPLNELGIDDFAGFDIDPNMIQGTISLNDSLVDIPATGRIIVTNPPFMSKGTATRYGSLFCRYFTGNKYEDIYLLALDKCLEKHDNVVAIVPETFLLREDLSDRLAIIVIIEEKIFGNTDCPVLVACFQKESSQKVDIHKGAEYLFTLEQLKSHDLIPSKSHKIVFNYQKGNIGLRGIDGTDGCEDNKIAFCRPKDLNYDREMKVSSRLISIVNVPCVKGMEDEFVKLCNDILKEYRKNTQDLLMAPFKGNDKKGRRRRRIDYKTARAIMEKAIDGLPK